MKEKLKIKRDKNGRFIKGHKVSKEIRIKISEANKGQHYSTKTEFKKGENPWNKNLIEVYSKETLKKMSESSKEIVPWHKGLTEVYSKETLKKMSESKKGNKNTLGKHWKLSKKTKGKMKIARSKRILPTKDTSIEVKIQNFLKQLGIEFFTHQYMKIEHGYQCDILIPSLNLVIECDGNYWHKYPIGLDRDHIRTKELIKKGFKVLRLWESDIRVMDIIKFKEKIK